MSLSFTTERKMGDMQCEYGWNVALCQKRIQYSARQQVYETASLRVNYLIILIILKTREVNITFLVTVDSKTGLFLILRFTPIVHSNELVHLQKCEERINHGGELQKHDFTE